MSSSGSTVTPARALGVGLALGCLVQACGTPAPVKEAPVRAVEPARVDERPRPAPKERRVAEIVIRYCTA